MLERRNFLQQLPFFGMAAGALGWADIFAAHAADLRKQRRACILLWMQGGPSQFETWDPKPDHENGGSTKSISTSVSGIHIGENLPHTAKNIDHWCVLRSLTSKEGSHPRASYLMHTGYLPTASVKYPTWGATVSHQLGNLQGELPGFVRIGNLSRFEGGGGLLGVQYDPFVLQNAERPPENTRLTSTAARFNERLQLLGHLEELHLESGTHEEVTGHQQLYAQSARMVLSPAMEAFDLSDEPDSTRTAYGEGPFAAGCLLARRLIEAGVTCVEVACNGWDTHQDNFTRTRDLCAQIDQPMSQLVVDLEQRGLLDSTLVIWMGEFGRTPRINPRAGRDHYPRAFSAALAGAGIRGGQVIGATNAAGTEVSDRPLQVLDLFRTFCHALKINPDQAHVSPSGRPIKIVDGGDVIEEAFT